ncbi:PTS system nitrogen regulatory IIA component [Caldanaerobacter subterraneus subsp. tengcongensis MB4]|uniref:Phosphotransferase system mannitol/fructose-specific IIA domain (Ntr-type) n=3 Tax=Caldanaerobacter subterraneus TaxID=911092 RepID=Q8R738_CALS4|nr:Phosphotransferase system mannitol/fructose-specific IIA domain (Ntr-type) [Caldanaerobacter subterraneus subsp. tengcongensis MB4]ERM91083.1 PTS fructose transporter subunit IIA [Caldanaerobacter subterraneus subsp. yonseiensis KB-1]MCS3917409.1 PTS system nitrogen regulatory IIA component [Caldanaerobacter subterraneus subsp. tengcongensis MB4]
MREMEIKDVLNEKMMVFDLKAKTKEEVLEELVKILKENDVVDDEKGFLEVVKKREEEFSTGIGYGVAIPHGKSSLVKKPSIVFGKSQNGIDYNSMDGKPAHLFFLIAVPDNSNELHLKVLADLSRALMHKEVREALEKASTPEEVIRAFEN